MQHASLGTMHTSSSIASIKNKSFGNNEARCCSNKISSNECLSFYMPVLSADNHHREPLANVLSTQHKQQQHIITYSSSTHQQQQQQQQHQQQPHHQRSSATATSNKRNTERYHVLKEIVSSEKKYMNDLREIVEGYYAEISRSCHAEPQFVHQIFSNITDIYEFTKSFVRLLDEPTCGGGSEDAHIASCFIREHTQFLRLYTIYCQSYKKAYLATERLERMPHLNQIVQKVRQKYGHSLRMASYLQLPVLRITKYHLLLQRYVKSVERDNVSESQIQQLAEALRLMKQVNDRINSDMPELPYELPAAATTATTPKKSKLSNAAAPFHSASTTFSPPLQFSPNVLDMTHLYGSIIKQGDLLLDETAQVHRVILFERMLVIQDSERASNAILSAIPINYLTLSPKHSSSNRSKSLAIVDYSQKATTSDTTSATAAAASQWRQLVFKAKTCEERQAWQSAILASVLNRCNQVEAVTTTTTTTTTTTKTRTQTPALADQSSVSSTSASMSSASPSTSPPLPAARSHQHQHQHQHQHPTQQRRATNRHTSPTPNSVASEFQHQHAASSSLSMAMCSATSAGDLSSEDYGGGGCGGEYAEIDTYDDECSKQPAVDSQQQQQAHEVEEDVDGDNDGESCSGDDVDEYSSRQLHNNADANMFDEVQGNKCAASQTSSGQSASKGRIITLRRFVELRQSLKGSKNSSKRASESPQVPRRLSSPTRKQQQQQQQQQPIPSKRIAETLVQPPHSAAVTLSPTSTESSKTPAPTASHRSPWNPIRFIRIIDHTVNASSSSSSSSTSTSTPPSTVNTKRKTRPVKTPQLPTNHHTNHHQYQTSNDDMKNEMATLTLRQAADANVSKQALRTPMNAASPSLHRIFLSDATNKSTQRYQQQQQQQQQANHLHHQHRMAHSAVASSKNHRSCLSIDDQYETCCREQHGGRRTTLNSDNDDDGDHGGNHDDDDDDDDNGRDASSSHNGNDTTASVLSRNKLTASKRTTTARIFASLMHIDSPSASTATAAAATTASLVSMNDGGAANISSCSSSYSSSSRLLRKLFGGGASASGNGAGGSNAGGLAASSTNPDLSASISCIATASTRRSDKQSLKQQHQQQQQSMPLQRPSYQQFNEAF